MIDMLLVLGKECLCIQCIVSADSLRLDTRSNIFVAQKLDFMSPHNLKI